LDDLDAGVVGGDVDLVERVEALPADEVARPDEVDLHHLAGSAGRRRRVRDALRRAAARPRQARRPSAAQDPLDRAQRRHDRAELLELPRDRGRADLRPRVGLQPGAHRQHLPLDLGVRAVGPPARRMRPTLRPPRIVGVIARRPLAHPLPRAPQLAGDHLR